MFDMMPWSNCLFFFDGLLSQYLIVPHLNRYPWHANGNSKMVLRNRENATPLLSRFFSPESPLTRIVCDFVSTIL